MAISAMIINPMHTGTISEIIEGQNHIKSIEITNPGIVITYNKTSVRVFIPWWRIHSLAGDYGEFEHELEQFYHLGVGGS